MMMMHRSLKSSKAHDTFFVTLLLILFKCNVTLAVPDDWNHGCSRNYNEEGNMIWGIPKDAEVGDLLLLFMSRSNDYLPMKLEGWKYAASCFKTYDSQEKCWTKEDCERMLNEIYCQTFSNGSGKDLAT